MELTSSLIRMCQCIMNWQAVHLPTHLFRNDPQSCKLIFFTKSSFLTAAVRPSIFSHRVLIYISFYVKPNKKAQTFAPPCNVQSFVGEANTGSYCAGDSCEGGSFSLINHLDDSNICSIKFLEFSRSPIAVKPEHVHGNRLLQDFVLQYFGIQLTQGTKITCPCTDP